MKRNSSCLLVIVWVLLFPGLPAVLGGSLFTQEVPVNASLFSDRRARSVGDIILISISESSATEMSGETTIGKRSSALAELQSLLYPMAATPAAAADPLFQNMHYRGSRAGMHKGTMPRSQWSSNSTFSGDGELGSSDRVTATVSAMIIEVLPNGNFILEGQRQIMVENEKRTITLSGIVRPEDISAGNSIESRLIANLKIHFDGKGPIASSRRRGWLGRIWEKIGLY